MAPLRNSIDLAEPARDHGRARSRQWAMVRCGRAAIGTLSHRLKSSSQRMFVPSNVGVRTGRFGYGRHMLARQRRLGRQAQNRRRSDRLCAPSLDRNQR
jgi:hypothetical protein